MKRVPPLACLLLLTPAASAQDDRTHGLPMVVTTDTQAYCGTLSQQIGLYRDLPPGIVALRDQGHVLCAKGNVRSGINRLRRVLMALRHDDRERVP